jgi:hypothetical protein
VNSWRLRNLAGERDTERITESAQRGEGLLPEEYRIVDLDLYMVMLKIRSVGRATLDRVYCVEFSCWQK